MTMEERKAKGLLWTDTPEAMEAQARARGLVYDFNHTRPEEKEKRTGTEARPVRRPGGEKKAGDAAAAD